MNSKVIFCLYFTLLHATTPPTPNADRRLRRVSAQSQLGVRQLEHQRPNDAGQDVSVVAQPAAEEVSVMKSMSTPRKSKKSKDRKGRSKERKGEEIEAKPRRPVRPRSNSVPFNAKRQQIIHAHAAPGSPVHRSPTQGTERGELKVRGEDVAPKQRPQSVTCPPSNVSCLGNARDNDFVAVGNEAKKNPERRKSRSKERKQEAKTNKTLRKRSNSLPSDSKRQQVVQANPKSGIEDVEKKEHGETKAIAPTDDSWTSFETQEVLYFKNDATDSVSMREFSDERVTNFAMASSRTALPKGDSVPKKGQSQSTPKMSSKMAGKQDVQLRDGFSDSGTVVLVPKEKNTKGISTTEGISSEAGTAITVPKEENTEGSPRARSDLLESRERLNQQIVRMVLTEDSVWETHQRLEEYRGHLLKEGLDMEDFDREKLWVTYKHLWNAQKGFGKIPETKVCRKRRELFQLHAKLALGRSTATELEAAIMARALHYAGDRIFRPLEVAARGLSIDHNKILASILKAEYRVLAFGITLARSEQQNERLAGLLATNKAQLQGLHVDAAGSMVAMAALARKPSSWAKVEETIRDLIIDIFVVETELGVALRSENDDKRHEEEGNQSHAFGNIFKPGNGKWNSTLTAWDY